jgi:hypothetical protein
MLKRANLTKMPSVLGLLLMLALWCGLAGWGSAQLLAQTPNRFQLGQGLYRETCGTCHIAVPPAVMPTDTWIRLITDPAHYGVQLQPLLDPSRLLVLQYLRFESRPSLTDEDTPYRVARSRYFKVLHPKTQLPPNLTLNSCVQCHPGASNFDFVTLKTNE